MESQAFIDSSGDENRKSYVKIGRLYNAIKQDMDIEIIENILQTEGDINCVISEGRGIVPNLLFSIKRWNTKIFDLLLDHGADFTSKNNEGRTIVHESLQGEKENIYGGHYPFYDDFLRSVLSAHVKFNNFTNPSDDNGMTHFHVACMANHSSAVEFFLNNGVDVNLQVKENSPIFPLCSPLHFAARYACLDVMEILLKYGANVHLKNGEGMSPIHLLIWINTKILPFSNLDLHEKALDVLLTFVINDQNLVNVVDDYGFSKCHWAAMVQDASLVANVLEGVEDLNQAVNLDSPVCPGYTPLHFATSFYHSRADIFILLLNRGADVQVKNARGLTAFELCLKHYYMDIHSILSTRAEWKNIVLSDNKTKLIDIVFAMRTKDGFISFLKRNKTSATIFVPFDSPLWPGYTLLHLAVVLARKIDRNLYHPFLMEEDNVEIVRECLKRGADIKTPDANGSTALHVAFYMEKRRLVVYLLNHHWDNKWWSIKKSNKFENPIDRNNLSHFHIACAARHLGAIRKFLSIGVDVNSPVKSTFSWHDYHKDIGVLCDCFCFFICPGSTALHINAMTGGLKTAEKLLKHGADVNAQDENGFTPVHRLLRARVSNNDHRRLIIEDENLKNSTTTLSGLTHLHVAASLRNVEAIDKLLKLGADINAVVTCKCKRNYMYFNEHDVVGGIGFDTYGNPDNPLGSLSEYNGYTPLHFSYDKNDSYETTLMLIERNADLSVKDAMGVSPLQKLLKIDDDVLLGEKLSKNIAIQSFLEREYGITNIHLACLLLDPELVDSLIECEEDVNAKVYSNSPLWQGYTPLHCAVKIVFKRCDENSAIDNFHKVFHLLMKHGADLLTVDDNNDTPIHLIKYCLSYDKWAPSSTISILFENMKNFNVNPTNIQGLSLFHIACLTENPAIIKTFLKNGVVDVNGAISHFSDYYPGSTPLHLVLKYYSISLSSENGCNDETFLQIVDMLLKYGADLNTTDGFGNTPLIQVMKIYSPSKPCDDNKHVGQNYMRLSRLRRILMEKFFSHGADVNATNLRGETCFELLINNDDTTLDDIESFLKAGCQLNAYNPVTNIGYMAKIFHSHWKYKTGNLKEPFCREIINNPQITKIDKLGRAAIHNVVSIDKIICEEDEDMEAIDLLVDVDKDIHLSVEIYKEFYTELIKYLLARGCDIDHQDNEGKTALHLAASFRNNRAIMELLANGADINITDKNGDTAFTFYYKTLPDRWERLDSYPEFAIDRDLGYGIAIFAIHTYKLEFCGFRVNHQNKQLKDNWLKFHDYAFDRFHEKMEKSKYLKIGSTSLSIYDFLTNTDMDLVYVNMMDEERRELDEFIENFDKNYFDEYHCLLKFKYRQTVERIKFIGLAVESLNLLIKYQLPDLCSRHIVQFLKNQDLKCLIASIK